MKMKMLIKVNNNYMNNKMSNMNAEKTPELLKKRELFK